MAGTCSVELTDLRFRAFHGLYEEERKTGNVFVVQLTVDYDPPAGIMTRLEDSVDYVALHDMVRQQMAEREDLLETVAGKLITAIHNRFPYVRQVRVRITKSHPPIPRFTGQVSVTLEQRF